MGPDEYVTLLGKIVSNLQALEFGLRAHFYGDDSPAARLPEGTMLPDLKAGDIVAENALTNYETLGQLIKRYNTRIANSDPDLKVDPNIVDLRDAIAHGRVLSLQEDSDLMLVKFSRPENGQVTVTFSECLTRKWLSTRVQYVHAEVLKVIQATSRARGR